MTDPILETAKTALDKWREAAQKWEARRIAKHMTAWEACGLQLWTALNGTLIAWGPDRKRLEAMKRELERVAVELERWSPSEEYRLLGDANTQLERAMRTWANELRAAAQQELNA